MSNDLNRRESMEITEKNDAKMVTDNELAFQKIVSDNINIDQLTEITDKYLLNQILAAVPDANALLRNTANNKFAKGVLEASQKNLYELILPSGVELVSSKDMKDAYRAFWITDNHIGGHANCKIADLPRGAEKIIAANTVSAFFTVSSMLSTQHYLASIERELDSIAECVNEIKDILLEEYEAEVRTLFREVKGLSDNALYIRQSDVRNEEYSGLIQRKRECQKLIERANVRLNKLTSESDISLKKYPKKVEDVDFWFFNMRVLTATLYQIDRLMEIFSSHPSSYSLHYEEYYGPVTEVQAKLRRWHQKYAEKLVKDESRRDPAESVILIGGAQALKRILHIPIPILAPKAILKSTHPMTKIDSDLNLQEKIRLQTNPLPEISLLNREALINRRVRLVIADGKMYSHCYEENKEEEKDL